MINFLGDESHPPGQLSWGIAMYNLYGHCYSQTIENTLTHFSNVATRVEPLIVSKYILCHELLSCIQPANFRIAQLTNLAGFVRHPKNIIKHVRLKNTTVIFSEDLWCLILNIGMCLIAILTNFGKFAYPSARTPSD